MKYPKSEGLGLTKGPDGQSYDVEFYGEDGGAAVILGPIRYNTGELEPVPEVHREPARMLTTRSRSSAPG